MRGSVGMGGRWEGFWEGVLTNMGWRVSCPRSLKIVPDSQYRKEESLVSWAGSFVQRTQRIIFWFLKRSFNHVDLGPFG